jgi:regulator of protease activity HflC (stomatin/prohibitin superfamily)
VALRMFQFVIFMMSDIICVLNSLLIINLKKMQNRSTNPVASLISLLVPVGIIAYFLSNAGIVSGPALFIWIVLILAVILIVGGLRIIDQYDRAVILTLGKYTSTRQPGLTWIMMGFQRMIKIDLRITTTDIPQQEVITKDNVPVGINAVVYFRVEDAQLALLNIKDYTLAVSQYAQAALRDVIGGIELDPLLSEREKIAEEIQKIVAGATQSWGVSVTDIKIQDIELPADMKRVMAKQAESERERRAVIIRAEGEFEASKKLAQAAEALSAVSGGLSMRTLQTIEKIQPDPSKTVIFALPVEILEGIKALGEGFKK